MEIVLLLLFSVSILIILYILFVPISIYLSCNIEDKLTGFISVKFFPFRFGFIPGGGSKGVYKIIIHIIKRIFFRKKTDSRSPLVDLARIILNEFDTVFFIINDLYKYIKGIIKSPDHYHFNISINGGFGPPDLTGQLFGLVESFGPLFKNYISISYNPDFMSDSINGTVSGSAIVRIYHLIMETLIFSWRLPKYKMIRIYQKFRKGG